MKNLSVLIADDDLSVRHILARLCASLSWSVEEASSGQEALDKMNHQSFQIFILDVKMPPPSGLDLAKIIIKKEPTAAILILTGYAEIGQAVNAIKQGVFDYVQKDNVNNEEIAQILHRAAEFHKNRVYQYQRQLEREKNVPDLEKSNKEFQALLELSRDIILIVDARTGQFSDCNQSACDNLEYNRQEILSLTLNDVVYDFKEWSWQSTFNAIRENSGEIQQHQFITKSRKMHPVETTCSYVCLDTGEYLTVIARDITDRLRLERQAKEKEMRYQTLFESSSDAIMLLDENGFFDCNNATLELFGFSNKCEFVQHTPADLSPPTQANGEDSASAANREIETAFFQNANMFEWIHRKTNGVDFPAEVLLNSFALKGKAVIQATVRDISQRKQAEIKIMEQQKQLETQSAVLRSIIESIEEGIVLADANGVIMETNIWFLNLVKTPQDFVIGQSIDKIIQLVTGCEILPVLQDYKNGKKTQKECLYADIQNQHLMLTLHPTYKQDTYQGMVLNIVDISDIVSEQKETEEELQYNRDFLSNAVQDIRTPINGITTLSTQLSQTTLDDAQTMLVQMIQDFAQSLDRLLDTHPSQEE